MLVLAQFSSFCGRSYSREKQVMMFAKRSFSEPVSVVASHDPTSRTPRQSKLVGLCAVLAALLCASWSILSAQTVTGNFGTVNIGTASPVVPLVFTFSKSDILGSTAVLMQGATGLDFTDAGSDTCMANTAYSVGQTCTVNVIFTPRFAGSRFGAVVLVDSTGDTIATGLVQGTGVGPQTLFQPGTQSVLGAGSGQPVSLALDGNGNLYVSFNNSTTLSEMLAVNGTIPTSPTIKTIGSGLGTITSVTMDGSGDLFLGALGNKNAVQEVMAVNGSIPASPTIRTLCCGFNNVSGIAVDGSGNVYITEANNTVLKLWAVNGSVPASPGYEILGSGFFEPNGIAVDASGNVYVADTGNRAVKEILAVNGIIPPSSPTIRTLGSGFVSPDTVAVDGNGNVFVGDPYSGPVKEILAVNGSIPASPTIITLGSGILLPTDVTVDGSGNVYVADFATNRVVRLDYADPPILAFASTAVGATSTDSPKTITVVNAGNAALNFPIPATGNNPSIGSNFTWNSSGTSACPLVTGNSWTYGTLSAGSSCQLPISFTPTVAGTVSSSLMLTDNDLNVSGYTNQTLALSGVGTQATPTIAWATPVAIPYGTALSAVQLNATSTVAATFTYSPAAGTVLAAGAKTLTATFTPTDTVDYSSATASVTLTVSQATPTIAWATPAAIPYGTALSATQLDASSTVAGTLSYSPAAGTVLAAGSQPLTATFTPTDTTDYTTATQTVSMTVTQATPTIAWATSAAITYGTALSSPWCKWLNSRRADIVV